MNLVPGKSKQDYSDIKLMKFYVFYVGALNLFCSYAPVSSCLYFRISVTSETFSEYLGCWDWSVLTLTCTGVKLRQLTLQVYD